jgi:hypothetical protein
MTTIIMGVKRQHKTVKFAQKARFLAIFKRFFMNLRGAPLNL